MVKVRDDGVFDAPIEKIWKYLGDETPGVHNHRSIVDSRTIENKESEMVFEWVMRNPDGKTTRKETWRMVLDPPRGFEMESLAGVSKGTKYTNHYTPMGPKTRVEIDGEFHMQGMDEAATRKAALGFLSEVFDEDQASLKKYE